MKRRLTAISLYFILPPSAFILSPRGPPCVKFPTPLRETTRARLKVRAKTSTVTLAPVGTRLAPEGVGRVRSAAAPPPSFKFRGAGGRRTS